MIPSGSRVTIDTCVLIYAFEHHPALGPDALTLLQRIEGGDLDACASVLVLTEFLTAVFARFDPLEAKKIRSALTALNISYLPVTKSIAVEAARLRAAYKLRTPDSLHVATALAGRAAVFVTNDRRLDRVAAEGLNVVQIGNGP